MLAGSQLGKDQAVVDVAAAPLGKEQALVEAAAAPLGKEQPVVEAAAAPLGFVPLLKRSPSAVPRGPPSMNYMLRQ